ncbi:hypothetical protein ACTU44_21720 (plasmid) [Thalassospira sp. SM2505]
MKTTIATMALILILNNHSALASTQQNFEKYVGQMTAADDMKILETRVFENNGPCKPSNAPTANSDKTGSYIGLYPGGDFARTWELSFQLRGRDTILTLGNDFHPLIYGVTRDGKYLVTVVEQAEFIDDDTRSFNIAFPIWAAVVENKWACFYLPGYQY